MAAPAIASRTAGGGPIDDAGHRAVEHGDGAGRQRLVHRATGNKIGRVTPDRIVRATAEPQNWLTYSGGYFAQRHSELREITPGHFARCHFAGELDFQRPQSGRARPGTRP